MIWPARGTLKAEARRAGDQAAPGGQAGTGTSGGAPAKLDIRALHKTFYTDVGFGQQKATVALDDINLTVTRGELVTVIGPSGSGKSTLLSIVAGLERQSDGEVLLDGEPIGGPGLDRGVVFQDFALFPWLTVRNNMRFGLSKRRLGKRREDEVIAELLQLVSLEGFGDYHPHALSGGMKQRVAIARALACDPEVLLMDEPFGALDAQTRAGLQQQFQSIWQSTGKTVMFVTHSVREAVYLSDRVIVLSARPGRIIASERVDLSRPREVFTPEFAKFERHLGRLLAHEAGGEDATVAFTD